MASRTFHFPSPDARKVIVSANPKAGARSGRPQIDAVSAQLTARGFDVETATDIDHVAAQAVRWQESGQLRCVVAAGGDGTVALVANRTPPGTPLAILPLGTENLLARYLGVSPDPGRLCDLIEHSGTVQLDAGLADGRIFLLMVSCGFDAEVVRRLHQERSGHIHHLSYAKPILDSIRTYQYPEVRVIRDPQAASSDSSQTQARWVFVANLPRYAGGLQILPQADGSDGLLDVCTFREGSLISGLVYLAGILFGQHASWEGCEMQQLRRVRLEPLDPQRDVPYQLDGDPGGFLPVEIEILPERLTLITPQAWAQTHGFETTPAAGA
ncbi:diacylglycerol/lipid kinase family protein [Lignipirellula cremea]|uniref:Lipid kinase n=1 Tax=Lignipirellula cremea TaxID=2528010 RepID=A0A518E156_9BACT|nr:diacylglycerol kinase family protein [Lignipirellula cremea]QDU97829.1 Putative lipid kinase [Lignipirellula cremea]